MQVQWQWSTTGTNLKQLKPEEIVQLCETAGLAGIEATAEQIGEIRDRDFDRLVMEWQDAGVTVSSLHLPFHEEDDVAAFYETDRVKAVNTLSMWMERAAALGAKVVVLHPSARNLDSIVEGFDRFLKQFGRSLNVLIPIAESLGLTIAVENMTPGDGIRFGSQPDHFQRFFAEFKHSHFGFCLDTGHALVSGGESGPSLMLAAMAPALVAFHLADNAGDRDSHLAPGKGNINWHRLFRDVMALGFSRTICIEAPPFVAMTLKGYSMKAWFQLVHNTETLVEKAKTVPLGKL